MGLTTEMLLPLALILVTGLPSLLVWGLVIKSQLQPLVQSQPSAAGLSAETVYPLAPMDGFNLVLTLFVCLVVPVIPVIGPVLLLGIWLVARPKQFVLNPQGLRMEWPLQTRSIGVAELVGAQALDRATFVATYGWPVRFGAGGFHRSCSRIPGVNLE